jgi:hypothetical protein
MAVCEVCGNDYDMRHPSFTVEAAYVSLVEVED